MSLFQMDRLCSKVLVGIASISILISCGKRPSASSPYKAEVIKPGASDYSLETVEFKYLTNVDSMDGSILKIIGHAALNASAGIDELINPADHNKLYLDKGRDVVLDYWTDGGVIKARNFDSMAMLTLYYNYEVVIDYWTSQLGLDLNNFGKLRMYYNPRVKASSEAGSIEQTIKVNAAFLPGPRDFLIFKTSALEQLPINMNQGVLAHEFGHAIFDYKFAGMDASVYTSSASAEEQLSGINEGIADFFSYAVTNRRTEYEKSLSSLGSERNLPVSWTLSTLNSSTCSGSFYCKGSILASALYEISQISGNSSLTTAKTLYESLDDFRSDWDSLKNGTSFEYYFLIKKFVANLDTSKKASACQVFTKWFDTTTFKEKMGC